MREGQAGNSTGRRILAATAVAGTLDILAAAGLSLLRDRPVAAMLGGIASGPFPGARDWGVAAASATGLAVHFAIIAAMAGAFVAAADRIALLRSEALLAGLAYGIATWAVMNLIVLPLRWPALFPNLEPIAIAIQLGCHILLVGLPIALIAQR